MDTISLQCIEEANSTDCLIRALIKFLENAQEDNDARFNWDPITFGFTVSIALVAAGFALITIVQAILVAGPGRRKSNSEAIGKWSKYTVRQWRFRDLGYLHIAKTPILTIQNVMAYLEAAEQQAREGEERSYYTPKIPTKTSYHHSKSFAASAAKWLVFLGEVGLSDLELSGEALETWLADYLPSDLLAVPALIEVQTAYIFMSLFCKPFRVLNTDARYPVLIGKDFQFEVRQHPTLGSIGTFSKYHHGLQDALVKTVSSSALSVTIKQANGIIPVSTAPEEMESDTDQEKRAQRREMRRLAHVGIVGDIDISSHLPRLWLALSAHMHSCSIKSAGDHDAFIPVLRNSPVLFSLMFAKVENAIPAIFPRSRLELTGIFEALSISANIAAQGMMKPGWNLKKEGSHILGLVFKSHQYRHRKCSFESFSSVEWDPSTCRCQRIIKICSDILLRGDTNGNCMRDISIEEFSVFRQEVADVLSSIDSWLQQHCLRRELRCAKFSLFSDTVRLQDIADSLNAAGSAKDKLSLAQFLEFYRQYTATRDGKSPESPFAVGKMHEGFGDLLVTMARRKGYNKSYVEGMMAKSNFQLLIPQNVENVITNWLEEDNFLGPEAEIGRFTSSFRSKEI